MVEKITTANFEEMVLQSEVPVLIDFFAEWCGPCKMMAPAVDAMAETFAGKLLVGKVNTDENMDLAMKYRVASIPFLALFKGGEIVDQIVGYVEPRMLEAMIRRNL